jgi:predicted phosphodiesterase
MRLLLLSDLHLEVGDLALADDLDFDVAVLAGDIVWPATRLREWVQGSAALRRARAVVAVNGNHEYFDRVLRPDAQSLQLPAGEAGVSPLHLLDAAQVIVDGVRFLGCTLWTDFELRIDTAEGSMSDRQRGIDAAQRAMVDYRAIGWQVPGAATARRLTPQDTLALHARQRGWLRERLAESFAGPTVVVTHHGPHRGSLAPRFAADWISTAYLSELPAEFFDVPRLWVHGHTHSSHDYRVGRCRVVCNPRGYQAPGRAAPENAHFDPGLVVTLE